MKQKKHVQEKSPYFGFLFKSSNFNIVLVLCFLLIFLSILLVSFAVMYHSLKNIQARNMYYTLRSYGEEIHDTINQIIYKANYLAHDSAFIDRVETYDPKSGSLLLTDNERELLLSAFNPMQGFKGLCAYNTQGEQLLNEKYSALCREAVALGTPVGQMDFSRGSECFFETVSMDDRLAFLATVPVHRPWLAPVGYVSVLLDTEYFTNLLGRYRFGKSGSMYALTGSGGLLFHQDITASGWQDLTMRNPQLLNALFESLKKDVQFVSYQYDDGPARYANSWYDSQYDFAIVSRINKSEITMSAFSSMLPLILSAVLLFVLTCFAVVLLYRRLDEPLRQMIDRCRLIKKGNTDIRFANGQDSDLNVLADTLNETISSLAVYQKDLESMAFTDPVTGIGNRLGCIHHMETLINNNCPSFSVYMVDIVAFDHFNEIFSSHIGDQLLKHVALYFQRYYPQGTFRYSADVFAVVVPCVDAAAHRRFHDTVKNCFGHPLNISGNSCPVSVRTSRADFPEHALSPLDILRNAKTALKYAKLQNGDVCVIYDSAVQEIIGRKSKIKDIVTHAVKAREVEVFYQPIYDLKKERFTKAEALLRLPNTALGALSPEEVVKVAEENGLISELGEIIIQKVCGLLTSLPPDIETIAINLSVVQIMQYGFLDRTRRILEESGIDTGLIEFEITEGVLISSFDSVQQTLNSLKHLGIRLALDDFGSGYSGINYLASLPIDTLKLDRSLITKLGSSERHTKLISSIVDLCKNFNLKVVAEGVEDSTLVVQASNHDIDYIQGFYYSRPLPPDEFLDFLKKRNP